MIAPIRDIDSTSEAVRRRLRRARHAAVSSLLKVETREEQHTQPMAAWKAWIASAWMVAVVIAYALHMARWW